MLFGEEVEIGFAHRVGGEGKPKTGSQGLVDPDEAAVGILEVDVVGEVIHQGVEEVPFLLEGRLGLVSRGDVPEDHLHADHLSAGIADGGFHHLYVPGFTVLFVLLHAL